MMKSLSTIVAVLFISLVSAQSDYNLTDGGQFDLDCDAGSSTITLPAYGADAAGETYSMTFCPDGGNAVSFIIDTETVGDLFDVAGGDVLNVYDGPDNTAPLLAQLNNNLHNFSESPVLSLFATLENPDGCLTIEFIASESTSGAGGFTGQLGCGNFWQPFSMNFVSSPSEIDEFLYIDICQGETITITADGVFPYSDGNGYEQTNENCFFEWDMGDGTEQSGMGLTSVSVTYTEQFGYPVELNVTDPEGLRQRFDIKVRVSTTPSFAGLLSQTNDTICLGTTATLIGGVAQDTSQSFGAFPVQSAFIGGGFLAGQTFLPDGSGASYETTIVIDDFPAGSTVEDPENIVAICATMEHSYLGDLDIELTCPDGTTIVLQEQGGGSCNLGEPWATAGVDGESSTTTPGVGYQYCWTADATQSLEEGCVAGIEFVSGNGPDTYTDSQVAPGNYSPDQAISNLVGCPINGDWTITVTDNIGADNGYIFSWGVQFDPTIDPTVENYAPRLIDGYWDDDPTILADQSNDTLIVVQPPAVGEYEYTFHVDDDFGCAYDTTVVLTVVNQPVVSASSPACNFLSDLSVQGDVAGGSWSLLPSDSSMTVLDGIDGEAQLFSDAGDYTLVYTDAFCQSEQAFDVYFPPLPVAQVFPEDSLAICIGSSDFFSAAEQPLGLPVNYVWSYSSSGNPIDTNFTMFGPSPEVSVPGIYTLTVTDTECGLSAIDLGEVILEPCVIETYNVFSPNGDGVNDVFYVQAIDKFHNTSVFVYNRWGNVVFERRNYTNNWDMDGLPEGTYYYVVHNPEKSESFKGYFTLVR